MRFTKMQALGNDYVYVNCFEQDVDVAAAGELAVAVSDRHFGVGADGLILIVPSCDADVGMRMFNSDGSVGLMCGNGIRCLAKYAYEHGLSRANPMRVETASGTRIVTLVVDDDGSVAAATVDMGEPILDGGLIGVRIATCPVLDHPINTSLGVLAVTCISVGNPHAVIFVDVVASVPLARLGPELARHDLFPGGINVHFVQVAGPGDVTVRTWERGSGITLACGTGAAAVCVAGKLTGRTDRGITAHLAGGDMKVQWRRSDNHVFITGPAVEVFSGQWPAGRRR